MTQAYHYAEIAAHASTLKAQADALETEHQAILRDVQQCADFWGGTGNTAYTDFVTELNKQFAIIFHALSTHGGHVQGAAHNTEHTDGSVAGTWV